MSKAQNITSQTKRLAFVLGSSLLFGSIISFNVYAEPSKVNSDTIKEPKVETTQVPAALINSNLSTYYSPYALIVDKKARQLSVWKYEASGLKKVADYPADLGKNEGEKKESGDKKTPTGIYFLQKLLEGNGLDHSLYGDRAFTTNYPNYFDRLLGKTGWGIWLHAVPDSVPLTRGSKGCVVVRNNVIHQVSPFIKLDRTPIIIEDETEWLSLTDLKKESDKLRTMIANWRSAWQSKNIEDYISHYDEDFSAQGMNKKKWKSFKKGLNGTYKQISVRLTEPVVYAYKGYAIVRMLQSYSSDQHEDFGEKLLYLKKSKADYKIIGEEWEAEEQDIVKAQNFPENLNSSSMATSPQQSGSPSAENNPGIKSDKQTDTRSAATSNSTF